MIKDLMGKTKRIAATGGRLGMSGAVVYLAIELAIDGARAPGGPSWVQIAVAGVAFVAAVWLAPKRSKSDTDSTS